MSCICYPMSIEGAPPNWNRDCEEHGVDSEWWSSPEQVENRRAQSERLRALQIQAREARSRSKNR